MFTDISIIKALFTITKYSLKGEDTIFSLLIGLNHFLYLLHVSTSVLTTSLAN